MTPTPEKAMTAAERASHILDYDNTIRAIDSTILDTVFEIAVDHLEAAERQGYRRGVEDSAQIAHKHFYHDNCAEDCVDNIEKEILKLAEGEK